MTLNAAIEAALPELRREAEARMKSRVTVRRKTGRKVPDPISGAEYPEWETVYTDHPFRLGGSRGDAQSRTVGVLGAEVQVGVRTGHLPVDTVLRDGDMLEVTVGENAGTVWQVVEADFQDQATARRVPLVGVSRPQEWS